ncbi:hypothetical protein, partial [Merdimonas faecis]
DGTMWSADMNSFNHYAYGAVDEWIFRVLCGIDTDEAVLATGESDHLVAGKNNHKMAGNNSHFLDEKKQPSNIPWLLSSIQALVCFSVLAIAYLNKLTRSAPVARARESYRD